MNHKTKFNHATPEASSGFLLWKLYAKWETGIKHLLKNHNLTHPQFVILATTTWFVNFTTPATQQELSVKTGIDPMTTSVIVRGLLKKGYLTRTSHAEDSRAYIITPTETGKITLQVAMDAVDNYDEIFFSCLSGVEKQNFAIYSQKLIG